MWPHMTMKPRQQQGDDDDGATDTDSDGADEDGNRRRDIHHDLGVPSGQTAPTTGATAAATPSTAPGDSDFGGTMHVRKRTRRGGRRPRSWPLTPCHCISPSPSSSPSHSPSPAFVRAEVRAAAGPPPEDQTDAALEGFERLLQAVQGVRGTFAWEDGP